MAQVMTLAGDLYVAGTVTPTGLTIPASAVTDNAVAAAAGIKATKLQHQHQKQYAQESATTSVSEARTVHQVFGATGTLVSLKAGNVVANIGAATVVVDLLKNGVSVLSATITLNNTVAAYASLAAAGFTSAAVVQGDVLEVKLTATVGGGTLAKGVFVQLTLREDAQ